MVYGLVEDACVVQMGWTSQDCAQLGLEARSRGRFSSNVNGTTACMSHVIGITGVRHIIDGNTEYNGYSWPICGWIWNAIGGWTSNSGLNLTVACWAIAVEANMSIDPAARVNCKDFGIVFLRTAGGRLVRLSENAAAGSAESSGMKTGQQRHRDKDKCRHCYEKIGRFGCHITKNIARRHCHSPTIAA